MEVREREGLERELVRLLQRIHLLEQRLSRLEEERRRTDRTRSELNAVLA